MTLCIATGNCIAEKIVQHVCPAEDTMKTDCPERKYRHGTSSRDVVIVEFYLFEADSA